MRGLRVLPLLLFAALILAADLPATWRPADHPAQVLRPVAGLTRPKRIVPIAAEVSGRVVDPGPELGQPIPANAFLVLDDRLVRADHAVASASVDQAKAESAFRAREAQRIEGLFAEGRISTGERDAAAHAAAGAALALATAQAQLARSGELLARHRVALPTGWQVLRRLREAGAVVQPGEAVLEAGDLSTITALLHLDEGEVASLGSAVASVRGVVHPVLAVRPTAQADPLSRKRPVEIELPGAAGGGSEVLLTLRLPDPAGALTVPEAFIRAELDGRFVRCADGRNLRVTVLRAADGGLALLPTPELLAAELVRP